MINFIQNNRGTVCVGLGVVLVIGGYLYINSLHSQKQVLKTCHTLKVGMLSADAPFMSINEEGNYEGFDVDIAQAIAQTLERNLVVVDMGLPELFVALEKGTIDMLMCGLSITNERLDKLAMVHYQGQGVKSYPLAFWQAIPFGVISLEDLKDKNPTICVLPGTTQEKFLSQFNFINVKVMNSYADIIMDLQYGKSTAALFDSAISSYIKKFPQLKSIEIPLDNFEEFGHGIAMHKNNTELAHQVTDIVKQLKLNGRIAELEHIWNMKEA
jgi:arginine/lysine/histidine transporter system substrate-binding protein